MEFTSIDCFRDLDASQQQRLRQATTERFITSGTVLVSEGEPSHSMYFVVSGRFSIAISEQTNAIAQIGAGQTIGEIGFLSGEPRTATAIAVRDSVVLRLARKDYDMLCETFPQLLHDVSRSLAKKLSAATARYRSTLYSPPRAICLCPAGGTHITEAWIDNLVTALAPYSGCKVLRQQEVSEKVDAASLAELTQWLNTEESRYELVIYLISEKADQWSALAFRQSDLVLLVADNGNTSDTILECNPAEKIRGELPQPPPCWIALSGDNNRQNLHSNRWLRQRQIKQYHHVCNDNSDSHSNGFARLARFLCGNATGLIASGGGAYTAAHMGCFRAFEEAGIEFDIVGGASGGSAMLAAMAAGVTHDELLARTEQMMVKSGALKKLTVPVYSLLDHTHFDQCLIDNYGERCIEDNWLRFFAVSTNLSTGEEVLHDRGPFWRAVRASSSIPGLLPPVVADNGELLVDGGILDSVPVKRMKNIKHGPNIVLCFEPNHQSRAGIEYEKLPGRKAILLQVMRNRSLKSQIDMPGIGSVLTQSMLLNNSSLDEAEESDLILSMSLPPDLKLNDWHRHQEIADIGYTLTKVWLEQHKDNPVLDSFRSHETA